MESKSLKEVCYFAGSLLEKYAITISVNLCCFDLNHELFQNYSAVQYSS